MVKISVISGFLGAGKSTFIKKLLQENFFGSAPVLVENDFGRLGIDSLVMENSGVQVHEITSGCICCSLIGNFILSLEELIQKYEPEHIIIEPSGVGKLSEILEALEDLELPFKKHLILTIVDARRFYYNHTYVNEYFWDQISHADSVILSKTSYLSPKKLSEICSIIHSKLPELKVITTPWDNRYTPILEEVLSQNSCTLINTQSMKESCTVIAPVAEKQRVAATQTAVTASISMQSRHMLPFRKVQNFSFPAFSRRQFYGFESWSTETCLEYSTKRLEEILDAFNHNAKYGTIIRAKGILNNPQGPVLLDYVPGEGKLSSITPDESGRMLVIGTNLNRPALERLFLT